MPFTNTFGSAAEYPALIAVENILRTLPKTQASRVSGAVSSMLIMLSELKRSRFSKKTRATIYPMWKTYITERCDDISAKYGRQLGSHICCFLIAKLRAVTGIGGGSANAPFKLSLS